MNNDLLEKIDKLRENVAQLEKQLYEHTGKIRDLEAQRKADSEKMGCSPSEDATVKVLEQKKLFHQGFFIFSLPSSSSDDSFLAFFFKFLHQVLIGLKFRLIL